MAENIVMHSKRNQYCPDQYRTRDKRRIKRGVMKNKKRRTEGRREEE